MTVLAPLGALEGAASRYHAEGYGDEHVANINLRDRKGSLNDGQIQNPSNPFGIVPLSRYVPFVGVLDLSIIQ